MQTKSEIRKLLEMYSDHMNEYIANIKSSKRSPSINIALMTEVRNLITESADFSECKDLVRGYVTSENKSLVHIGWEMLSLTTPDLEDFNLAINSASNTGVDCYPYYKGRIISRAIESDVISIEMVKDIYYRGSEKLKQAILSCLNVEKRKNHEVLDEIITSGLSSHDIDTKNQAIIALPLASNGNPGKTIDLLKRELMSPHWFIRGNSIVALSMIEYIDADIVGAMKSQLLDNEGHDWSVCSATLNAIHNYGTLASDLTPNLVALCNREIIDNGFGYDSGYPNILYLCMKCIEKIGAADPIVRELFMRCYESENDLFALKAMKHLASIEHQSDNFWGRFIELLSADDCLISHGDLIDDIVFLITAAPPAYQTKAAAIITPENIQYLDEHQKILLMNCKINLPNELY